MLSAPQWLKASKNAKLKSSTTKQLKLRQKLPVANVAACAAPTLSPKLKPKQL